MSAAATAGLTLDTGALLALDHPGKAVAMQARLDEARRRGGTICIPAEVVAQAWRSSRQARLARLLKSSDIDVAVMTLSVARSVGLMCADVKHNDVVDVHVVLCARQRHHAIVTSDPHDIARVDPAVPRILVLVDCIGSSSGGHGFRANGDLGGEPGHRLPRGRSSSLNPSGR